jgi:hypothetical protein
MCELAKGMFAEIFFAEYFFSTEEPSESSPIIYRPLTTSTTFVPSKRGRGEP